MNQEIIIPREIMNAFFNAHQPQIVSVARWGASGPKVVCVRNGTEETLALKYDPEKVAIPEQVKNYHVLAEHIAHRLPRIVTFNERAMLMQAIDGLNLHEVVMSGNFLPLGRVMQVVSEIFAEFRELWVKTKANTAQEPFSPGRDFTTSLQRIIPIATETLEDYGVSLHDLLVINGVEAGMVRDLTRILAERYSLPQFSVLCHSDLNADNFMVTQSGQWYVTDYECVARVDWRRSLAHSYLWWISSATELKSVVEVNRIAADVVELRYELVMPRICSEIQECCLAAGQMAAEALGDEQWHQQFRVLVAGILLGETRFLQQRGRVGYDIPLLGEAFRMLAELKV